MTTFSKILALLTTAACFAFLGFVMVTLIAGPNWPGETNELTEYSFQNSGGENPTWSAKLRANDQQVSSNPVLPKVIVDVLNQINQEQQQQIGTLDEQIQQVDTVINDPNQGLKAVLYKDIAALKGKDQQLETELNALRAELAKTSRELTDLVIAIESIYLKAERRRGDIYRLENVVAEIETDEYRAVEHQEKLRDVWERYQGVIQRLQQRKDILEKQIKERNGSGGEEAPQTVSAIP